MTESLSVDDFWTGCRAQLPQLPESFPAARALGATPEHADMLLGLVLAGVKTGTASSAWDYEHSGEPLPQAGALSILVDGEGAPRAVIEMTDVRVIPFDEVDAEHAHAEGIGDRSLAVWRQLHEGFWRAYSADPRGYAPDMPVVCQRFRLLYPQVASAVE